LESESERRGGPDLEPSSPLKACSSTPALKAERPFKSEDDVNPAEEELFRGWFIPMLEIIKRNKQTKENRQLDDRQRRRISRK
jgi:hypothetical protein